MPTPMLLATNYSYDYWIIAWLMLGTATYFSEMQKPDKKISGKSILIILFSMLMACLPKQTYVPMLLPLLFIKRSKFSTKRLHRIYILSVIILGIVILATLFLMRMNSLMTGDNRGGEEVSGVGQIHYILTNPLGFIQTLLLFIKDYISYASMGHTLTFLAYLGTTSATSYAACFLVILAITDKAEGGLDFCTWSTRLLTWTGGLITIILIATTLYISFTPVGLNTVNGCQPRYLLPLIFPATYLIGSCKFENKMNRTLYYYMGYGMTAFILLTAIWERLAGHYL
jgi:uncharacterized membrane protein